MTGIKYVTHEKIDKVKWNACLNGASNHLIYAYSVYLDTMAGNWDAIILNDYEAVMPLTWKKKYGIYYLYQPFFTASLGVFGNNITAELLQTFLLAIPAKFKYWDIYLNSANHFKLPNFKLYDRINYTLSLKDNYENLFAAYKNNLKRNIKKAENLQLKISKNINVDDVIDLAKNQGKIFSPAKHEDYERFKKLYQQLLVHQQAITYGVFMPSGRLVASCVFFIANKRAYYILVGNDPDGKTIGASHALINEYIKDNAGNDLILDFEGSDISSLAFFYSSFGATPEINVGLKLNKLPKILQLFKS